MAGSDRTRHSGAVLGFSLWLPASQQPAVFMRIYTESVHSSCPYCGERISLVVDLSIPEQEYVEDCSVCCRPMVVAVLADDDGARVSVRGEDEA